MEENATISMGVKTLVTAIFSDDSNHGLVFSKYLTDKTVKLMPDVLLGNVFILP